MPFLSVRDLSVSFAMPGQTVEAVRNSSFSMEPGEILALIGESGSGKSVTAHAVLRLLPPTAQINETASIQFEGKELLQLSESELRRVRGARIGMIFQEPMTSLNPLHTIGKQVAEAITIHQPLSKQEAAERVAELFGLVKLEGLSHRLDAYPHELSGGQRQRVMIAMALAHNPSLLIADEPTTALDVTIQAQILALIKDLQQRLKMAVLLISHDLTLIRNFAGRVAVMKAGTIVEIAPTRDIFERPAHSYTRQLLDAIPKGEPLPASPNAPVLFECSKLNVLFRRREWFTKTPPLHAVKNISLSIQQGQTLGIVGESGSGKSTLGLALLRLIPSTGAIRFDRKDISQWHGEPLRALRKEMQIIFQDPFASLNPRLSVGDIIAEGLRAHDSDADPEKAVETALKEVGLEPRMRDRYPHEFSGGQRQRVAIARALILKPKFIVLDEPTSALDVSTQSEILKLLKSLQQAHGLTYFFISHDLRVIKTISHRIAVLKQGEIVEQGTSQEILRHPKTDYTRALLGAAGF